MIILDNTRILENRELVSNSKPVWGTQYDLTLSKLKQGHEEFKVSLKSREKDRLASNLSQAIKIDQ